MVDPQVTLDPRSLSPVEDKLRGPLEDQLTSALQAAADKIQSEYAGQSADELTVLLLERTRRSLHPDIAAGFTPDRSELHRVAEAIIDRAS